MSYPSITHTDSGMDCILNCHYHGMVDHDCHDAFLMAGQRTHVYTVVREWTDRIDGHCRPDDGLADPSLRTYSVY